MSTNDERGEEIEKCQCFHRIHSFFCFFVHSFDLFFLVACCYSREYHHCYCHLTLHRHVNSCVSDQQREYRVEKGWEKTKENQIKNRNNHNNNTRVTWRRRRRIIIINTWSRWCTHTHTLMHTHLKLKLISMMNVTIHRQCFDTKWNEPKAPNCRFARFLCLLHMFDQ